MRSALVKEELVQRYKKEGYWTEDTTPDLWRQRVKEHPDKVVLVDSRHTLTRFKANLMSDRLALNLVRMGFQHDDVLIAQLPNCVETMLVRLACQKAGVLFSPPGINLRHREMEHLLKVSGAKGVAIPREFAGFDYFDMIQSLRPNLPELKYVMVIGDDVPEGGVSVTELMEQPIEKEYLSDYLQRVQFASNEADYLPATTGTTGLPKLTGWRMDAMLYLGRHAWELNKVTGDDIMVCILNCHLGGSLVYAWGVLPYAGQKMVLLEKFDPGEALAVIEREKATIAAAVPAQLIMMLNHPDFDQRDLSSLRLLLYSGAPLPYNVGKELESRIGCVIGTEYGSMDFGKLAGHGLGLSQEERLLSSGALMPGNEIRILGSDGKELPSGEIGEVIARGPGMTSSGYYKDAETTKATWDEEGYFHFGDLCKVNEKGLITIMGRSKDMIIRGGQNIYPIEIENLLLTHPKVYNVAIVSMPDPVLGEKACAYVVPEKGETLTFEEMTGFLLEKQLAKFKLPERLEIIDSLPMVGDSTKVDKNVLVEDIARIKWVQSKVITLR